MEVSKNKNPSPDDRPPLFGYVTYAIIQSQELNEDTSTQLATLLNDQGADQQQATDDLSLVNLDGLTHIISSTIDFPQYEAAEELCIPVVKPEWVTASAKEQRLVPVRAHTPDPRLFFSGVTITYVDLPDGDKDAISTGVVALGGQCLPGLTKSATHLLTLTAANDVCQKAKKKFPHCKIVLPHWFDECLKSGTLLDEAPYSLTASQPPSTMTESLDRRPTELNVFRAKSIMLSRDLALGSHLRSTLEHLVTASGGSVAAKVGQADTVVCQFRDGPDYEEASKAGKAVGSLAWLYHLIVHDAWTPPLRRLLHYPVARSGIPGFSNFRIAISNFEGEARWYLERLVLASGATFTRRLKEDNTHLICARLHGDKCEAAKEWKIQLINQMWLEDSYATWEPRSPSEPRYQHFPMRAKPGEALGPASLDVKVLEKHFFPAKAPDEGTRDQSRRDSDARKVVEENSSEAPTSSETLRPSDASSGRTPKARRGLLSKREPADAMTPRIKVDGKENETPASSGRSAKNRAMARLHDLAPDIALYEKEKKRVGGVVWGGLKSSDERNTPSKRQSSHALTDDLDDGQTVEEGRDKKRARSSKLPPVTMRLILTGYQKWVGQPQKEADDTRRLRELGIRIVQEAEKCTHLAAPAVVRTPKFLVALAYAPVMVSTRFVDDCLEHGRLLRDQDYLLDDPTAEEKFGIRLEDVLRIAKDNNRKLLQSYHIYCTDDIPGGFETHKAIVEANGGQCRLFRSRTVLAPVQAQASDGTSSSDSDEADETWLVLISHEAPNNRLLWARFRQLAAEKRVYHEVVTTEWLLNLAMTQIARFGPVYSLGTSPP